LNNVQALIYYYSDTPFSKILSHIVLDSVLFTDSAKYDYVVTTT